MLRWHEVAVPPSSNQGVDLTGMRAWGADDGRRGYVISYDTRHAPGYAVSWMALGSRAPDDMVLLRERFASWKKAVRACEDLSRAGLT